jgi:flagellar protein FlgJ
MGIEAVNASFYADPASLDGLKRQAGTQSPEALRQAAREFESLFTSMMLKSMRSASGDDPLFGSDQADMYQDMFDQQMATQLSRGKGLGLADMLVRQLMQRGGADAPAAQGGEVKGGPEGRGMAALDAGSPAAAAWPPRNRQDFISAIRPAASAAARELGVDADTIIAHAALETGWGQSMPVGADGRPSFNLFGIKAGGSWQGASVAAMTREFSGGRMQSVNAGFRAYASPEQSIGDYVKLLKGNARYASALGTGSDVAAFARGLSDGGYATDPAYVAKLTAVAASLKGGNSLPIHHTSAS